MPLDFLGETILEGDEVIYCQLNYRNLTKGIVKRITHKMLVIECGTSEIKQFHSQVIVNKGKRKKFIK